MKDFNYKQLALNELKWMTIYLAVAFVIMLFLPFPVDLAVALLAFLALSWYKRNLLIRKLDMENPRSRDIGFEFKRIKEYYKSIFSNVSHSNRLWSKSSQVLLHEMWEGTQGNSMSQMWIKN